MKKVFLLSALATLMLSFKSCRQEPAVEPVEQKPVVQKPTKAELISREWTLNEIKSDGHTMSAAVPYLFTKDGIVKGEKDASGNWKTSGKWQFENNEANVRVFAGQPGKEMYWDVVSLSESKMEVEWKYMSNPKYEMTFIAK